MPLLTPAAAGMQAALTIRNTADKKIDLAATFFMVICSSQIHPPHLLRSSGVSFPKARGSPTNSYYRVNFPKLEKITTIWR
jgi:hypothetical protein